MDLNLLDQCVLHHLQGIQPVLTGDDCSLQKNLSRLLDQDQDLDFDIFDLDLCVLAFLERPAACPPDEDEAPLGCDSGLVYCTSDTICGSGAFCDLERNACARECGVVGAREGKGAELEVACTGQLQACDVGRGDPCTGHDECAAGVCGGPLPLCSICDAGGGSCDDGDACTGPGTCVPVISGGTAQVACVAPEAVNCGEPLDGACMVGYCDHEDGTCKEVSHPDGVPCDDGSGCTTEDRCEEGACQGLALPLCGTEPGLCEPEAANETLDEAVKLELAPTADPLVVVFVAIGWLDSGDDVDWYEVQLVEGAQLHVATLPHCEEKTDTVLTVLHGAESGGALEIIELATDDDGGTEKLSAISNLPVTASGSYFIGVSGHQAGEAGGYVLEVQVDAPPPCFEDIDCGCALKKCVDYECVPTVPSEVEPNDAGPADAGPALAIGGSLVGAFGTTFDEDWYVLTLEAGTPVTIETSAFCGGPVVDPALYVYDSLAPGAAPIAQAHDTGGDGHALLEGLTSAKGGTLFVRLVDEGVGVGHYVVEVSFAGCGAEAGLGCECPLETCQGAQCVPKSPGLEPFGPDAPLPLAVNAPAHGAIEKPFDVDSWTLTLGPGDWTVRTEPFCDDAPLDTDLEVYDDDGTLVAEDADSGEGYFAMIESLVVTQPIALRIDVRAHGAGTGTFALVVEPAAGGGG